MKKIQEIIPNFDHFIKNELPIKEQEHISWIKKNPNGFAYGCLAADVEHKAIYSLFIEGSIAKSKQYFYLISRLNAMSASYGSWDLESRRLFIYPLLSDSKEIIDIYANLDTKGVPHKDLPNYQTGKLNPTNFDSRFGTYALQCMLKKDWENYYFICNLSKKNLKKLNINEEYEFNFYDSLIAGDVDQMTHIIHTLLKPNLHKRLNYGNSVGYGGRSWSFHPTIFTKLAWMFGYEIHIEHDLVPMSLMPVQPLEHYDDYYDFLKPDYDWNQPPSKKKSFADILFGKLW